MYRYDVARRVLTRIHVQQQLKGDRYVCFIDTNNGIWLSDQENDFHYYPEKAAFNNLSSIFERLEDPFVKNLLFDYEGYLWMRSSHDIASYDIGGDKIAFHLADGGLYGHIFIDSKNRLWVIRNRSEVRQYAIREGKIVREEKICHAGGRREVHLPVCTGQHFVFAVADIAPIGYNDSLYGGQRYL